MLSLGRQCQNWVDVYVDTLLPAYYVRIGPGTLKQHTIEIFLALKKMNYATTWIISKALSRVKESNFKRLYVVWFHLLGFLKKMKLWWN